LNLELSFLEPAQPPHTIRPSRLLTINPGSNLYPFTLTVRTPGPGPLYMELIYLITTLPPSPVANLFFITPPKFPALYFPPAQISFRSFFVFFLRSSLRVLLVNVSRSFFFSSLVPFVWLPRIDMTMRARLLILPLCTLFVFVFLGRHCPPPPPWGVFPHYISGLPNAFSCPFPPGSTWQKLFFLPPKAALGVHRPHPSIKRGLLSYPSGLFRFVLCVLGLDLGSFL